MPLFNTGAIIRELRIAQGFTQEKLAEGICSRQTVVKLEKGERRADWFVIRNIFIRLGVDPDNYYSELASENDIYVLQRRDECARYFNTAQMDKFKDLVETLELDKRFLQGGRNGRGYMLLLRYKAYLYTKGPYKDFLKALDYYKQVLNLTRPGFDMQQLPNYFLSYDEFLHVNGLANTYLAQDTKEGYTNALEIYQHLKNNYDKNSVIHLQANNNNYLQALGNIAECLVNLERYEECLPIATESLLLATQSGNVRLLHSNMHRKAWCLLHLNHEDEGRELLKKAFLLAYVLDGSTHITDDSINHHKKLYQEKFGAPLDLSVPW